jgi:hypothetical protein
MRDAGRVALRGPSVVAWSALFGFAGRSSTAAKDLAQDVAKTVAELKQQQGATKPASADDEWNEKVSTATTNSPLRNPPATPSALRLRPVPAPGSHSSGLVGWGLLYR